MVIREALPEDIPQIVAVLKASLGEADLPISEEIWNFKHVDNPFGKSIVLLAEEGNRIAGVRAFMRWKWKTNNKEYSAFRAVDTSTHPEFQGKGIFKKLTLKAVQMGVETNNDFVFNTPNEKSRPGYLKMDWQKVGKLYVGLVPAWNSFYKITIKQYDYNLQSEASNTQLDILCRHWNKSLEQEGKIFTPKSKEYLFWRYENNPLQGYEVYCSPDLYIAGYVRERKNIKELRISECIFKNQINVCKQLNLILKKWCSKFGVQVMSYSPGLFPNRRLSVEGNFGPVLTVRNLNLNQADKEAKMNIKNWNYSLGDLELF